MLINLFIITKNKNSLIYFLNFFRNFYKKNTIKNIIIFQYFQKKKKKKKFFILKSPHINKKSIESFENSTFAIQIKIFFFNAKKIFFLLKIIKFKLFSDLKFEISFDKFFFFINPDCFLVKKKLNGKKLKIFDIYGETSFRYLCLDSSVGRAKD